MKIPDSISAIVGPIRAIRRDIHAHPELKFEENRTAEIVSSALRGFGIDEIHTGLGKTGVVGILRGRPGSKMLGLRADMDALPMTELNAFEHKSQYAGKMHACGHDGHTATLLAAAKIISADRDFAGSVAFIFQPAGLTSLSPEAPAEFPLPRFYPARYGSHQCRNRAVQS